MTNARNSAVLLVDVQNDFCPGGALPVPDGNRVVPVLNAAVEQAVRQGLPIYASRDWHPPVTSHFKEHGGSWPVHCVRDSPGARFHPGLRLPPEAIVVTKGVDPASHGYSAFDGTIPGGVPLGEDLRRRGITHLIVGGLATDYCVKQSVLDARRQGFEVTVLQDAIAGVDVSPGDSARAVEEMRTAGVRFQ
jgi:nicotinamidase/pyrazinamidase